MIAKLNYNNDLGRAKALLSFLKEDAAKYAALPTAKKFVTERHQANIKALEEFLISLTDYVEELEDILQSSDELVLSLERQVCDLKRKSEDAPERIVNRYHFPKDKETIRALSISAVMANYNDLF